MLFLFTLHPFSVLLDNLAVTVIFLVTTIILLWLITTFEG